MNSNLVHRQRESGEEAPLLNEVPQSVQTNSDYKISQKRLEEIEEIAVMVSHAPEVPGVSEAERYRNQIEEFVSAMTQKEIEALSGLNNWRFNYLLKYRERAKRAKDELKEIDEVVNTKFNPSTLEGNVSSTSVIKELWKDTKNISSYLANCALKIFPGAVLFYPSVVRDCFNKTDAYADSDSDFSSFGDLLTVSLGSCFYIWSASGAHQYGYGKEFFIATGITNALSLGYEVYRHKRNKLKEKRR